MRLLPIVLLLAACGGSSDQPTDAAGADAPRAGDAPPHVDAPASPWTVELAPVTGAHFNAVWGSGPTDIYAVGVHGNTSAIFHSTGNGTWTEQTTGLDAELYSIWGSSATDVYVGGFGNTLLHSTGNGTWTSQTIPNLGVLSIFGTSATDVYFTYAASSGVVYHSTGNGTWTPRTLGATGSILSAVWATSATDIYFAGGTGSGDDTPYILHGAANPTTEQMPALPDMFLRNVVGMWGSSAADLYAVGNSDTILHGNGSGAWTLQPGPSANAEILAVWGSGPADIYLATDSNGTSLHGTGDGTWTPIPGLPVMQMRDVWGAGSGDVYFVGDRIAHGAL